MANPDPSLARWASARAPTAFTSVGSVPLERATAIPASMLIAPTVGTDVSSALIPMAAPALPPKPTEAAVAVESPVSGLMFVYMSLYKVLI